MRMCGEISFENCMLIEQQSMVFVVHAQQLVIWLPCAIIKITARLNNKCFTLYCGLFNVLGANVAPR